MAECGTVVVDDPFDPSAVSVVNCRLSTTNADPGEAVTAAATVENGNNNTGADVTVRFEAGGTSATAEETVAVPPGGASEASVEFEFGSPGSYPINVSKVDARRR